MCKEKQIGFSFIDLPLSLLSKLAEDPMINRTFTDFAPTLHRLWYGGRAKVQRTYVGGLSELKMPWISLFIIKRADFLRLILIYQILFVFLPRLHDLLPVVDS